jgi:hypothetical protein
VVKYWNEYLERLALLDSILLSVTCLGKNDLTRMFLLIYSFKGGKNPFTHSARHLTIVLIYLARLFCTHSKAIHLALHIMNVQNTRQNTKIRTYTHAYIYVYTQYTYTYITCCSTVSSAIRRVVFRRIGYNTIDE